jgi:hypothetical protein
MKVPFDVPIRGTAGEVRCVSSRSWPRDWSDDRVAPVAAVVRVAVPVSSDVVVRGLSDIVPNLGVGLKQASIPLVALGPTTGRCRGAIPMPLEPASEAPASTSRSPVAAKAGLSGAAPTKAVAIFILVAS